MATLASVKESKETPATTDEATPAPRGRGRPPGTKNKPKTAAPAEAGGMSPEALDALLDTSLGELGNLPVVVFKLPPALSDQEKQAFAGATKPVLIKYLGDLLENFGPELVCCVTLYSLFWPRYLDRSRKENASGGSVGERKNGESEEAGTRLDPASSA